MRARDARRRGDIAAARRLIGTCLEQLPGSQEFAEFAEEVGAALPPRAIQIRAERAAAEALIAPNADPNPVLPGLVFRGICGRRTQAAGTATSPAAASRLVT